MGSANVIFWRDIPTQIVSGKGRKATKHQLSDRFMVAVDKAAMNGGASDTDAYLAEWRKVAHDLNTENNSVEEAVKELAETLEKEYPTSRLAALAQNEGREPTSKS